jgi:hypothetical protein
MDAAAIAAANIPREARQKPPAPPARIRAEARSDPRAPAENNMPRLEMGPEAPMSTAPIPKLAQISVMVNPETAKKNRFASAQKDAEVDNVHNRTSADASA